MASSPCPAGWPLAHTPGAKRGSLPPPAPSEPVAMPMKHIPKSQEGPFAFLRTSSNALLLYGRVPCVLLIREAGSELSLSSGGRCREEEGEKARVLQRSWEG